MQTFALIPNLFDAVNLKFGTKLGKALTRPLASLEERKADLEVVFRLGNYQRVEEIFLTLLQGAPVRRNDKKVWESMLTTTIKSLEAQSKDAITLLMCLEAVKREKDELPQSA